MDKVDSIKEILEKLEKGIITASDAYDVIKFLPFKDIGNSKLDFHRKLRTGIEEIIYGKEKTIEDLKAIIGEFLENNRDVMVTKLSSEKAKELLLLFKDAEYFEKGNVLIIENKKKELYGNVLVVTAGTSDLPVAEEAYLTAKFLGSKVELISDIGIAGIHRILKYKDKLSSAKVIIAVAGMDGALPAVLAGMFGKPVIGVPTSVGYGASFNGIAPMLTMLNSCAPGVTVVNIDNGFGAAVFAHMVTY